jgi:hypothetical protein
LSAPVTRDYILINNNKQHINLLFSKKKEPCRLDSLRASLLACFVYTAELPLYFRRGKDIIALAEPPKTFQENLQKVFISNVVSCYNEGRFIREDTITMRKKDIW